MDVVSRNEKELRYGPVPNGDEYYTTLRAYKSKRSNTVSIVDCDQMLLSIVFRDPRFKDWTAARYGKSILNDLSHFWSGFLRHWGCQRKGSMSCDSGGWFPWKEVCDMLTNGFTKRISYEAARFHDVPHGEWGSVAVFMLQALVPARASEKTRFQVAVDVDGETGEYIMPLALRACSGQQNLQQLDPSRFAAIATPELLAKLPGLFHITLLKTWRRLWPMA